MNQDQIFDRINQRLEQLMPAGLTDIKNELQHSVKVILTEGFSKLNTVSRDGNTSTRGSDKATQEDYEIQTAVLAKTRAKLEQLEKQVQQLESIANS